MEKNPLDVLIREGTRWAIMGEWHGKSAALAFFRRAPEMARYKYIDTKPRFPPVDLARQLLPGTFEHAPNHLIEHEIDISYLDARYRNDETGAPAYPPTILLNVVPCAYAHGVVSTRAIERVSQEHVTIIALTGGIAPNFTTIAHVVSSVEDKIAHILAGGARGLRPAGQHRAGDLSIAIPWDLASVW